MVNMHACADTSASRTLRVFVVCAPCGGDGNTGDSIIFVPRIFLLLSSPFSRASGMAKRGGGARVVPHGPLFRMTCVLPRRGLSCASRVCRETDRSFVHYGLEHWGCDQLGVNKTRRFLLEWLSFTHRYIPVGILEVLPQRINERPLPYVSRVGPAGWLADPSHPLHARARSLASPGVALWPPGESAVAVTGVCVRTGFRGGWRREVLGGCLLWDRLRGGRPVACGRCLRPPESYIFLIVAAYIVEVSSPPPPLGMGMFRSLYYIVEAIL